MFLIWNDRKASLSFGGATNREFVEFLLHFPSGETFQFLSGGANVQVTGHCFTNTESILNIHKS